jgi:hypothetical protein
MLVGKGNGKHKGSSVPMALRGLELQALSGSALSSVLSWSFDTANFDSASRVHTVEWQSGRLSAERSHSKLASECLG